jgi:hypothetical protein
MVIIAVACAIAMSVEKVTVFLPSRRSPNQMKHTGPLRRKKEGTDAPIR